MYHTRLLHSFLPSTVRSLKSSTPLNDRNTNTCTAQVISSQIGDPPVRHISPPIDAHLAPLRHTTHSACSAARLALRGQAVCGTHTRRMYAGGLWLHAPKTGNVQKAEFTEAPIFHSYCYRERYAGALAPVYTWLVYCDLIYRTIGGYSGKMFIYLRKCSWLPYLYCTSLFPFASFADAGPHVAQKMSSREFKMRCCSWTRLIFYWKIRCGLHEKELDDDGRLSSYTKHYVNWINEFIKSGSNLNRTVTLHIC